MNKLVALFRIRFRLTLLIAAIGAIFAFVYLSQVHRLAELQGAQALSAALALVIMVIVIFSLLWALLYWPLWFTKDERRAALETFESGKPTRDRPAWVDCGLPKTGKLDALRAQHHEFLKQQESFRKGDGPPPEAPELRIGIVLAGGGAKGVYQAGAMKALWDFLSREEALANVRVICATSIGSWNAMFWLTGRADGSEAREWWRSAGISTIARPAFYVPIWFNYLGRTQPWRAQFKRLFAANWGNQSFPYFYLTRTDVGGAKLEVCTNRSPRKPGSGRYDFRELPNDDRTQNRPVAAAEVESAVFASMNIPPAFRRITGSNGEQYEDGGVIDNLPIRYATWFEGCNLLFIFALNASFAARNSNWSIIKRLVRVTDIRQGALEQDALSEISIYNELIKARAGAPAAVGDLHSKPATTFCICPDSDLKVSTLDFSKLKRNGEPCWQLMYNATKTELEKFDFSPTNNEVWMAKVRNDGRVSYQDFTLRL